MHGVKTVRSMVTGGAGFIGSSLVDRLLAEGHSVDVVDDLSSGSLANLAEARSDTANDLSFHRLDIRSPTFIDLVARRQPEIIFHLAAQSAVSRSVEKPTYDAEVNIIGTLHTLEGARAAGTSKVVYAASGGTLYGEGLSLPITEDQPHAPASPYGASKKAGIDYLQVYRKLHGIEFTALALANVYGPRQDPHGEAGVVSIFAGNLLAGKQCTINGDGHQTRDFVFVDDVVDAFARAADRGPGEVLNIGTGVETSVSELYAAMAEVAETTLPPAYGPARAGDLKRSSLDPTRAGEVLGWRPWTTIDKGAAIVLRWFNRRIASNR